MAGPTTSFVQELRRRKVFRVAAMYAVAGWLLLQVGEVTFEPLGLPAGSLRVLIFAVAVGFPAALVLGWLYDWTSRGPVRTPNEASIVAPVRRDEAPSRPATRPAIAVLPFSNISGDASQDYLGDGIAEDLITRMAAWDMRVVARNSSFAFRETARDMREVSQELGARYIVEGRVRREGDQVRSRQSVRRATPA